MSGGGQRPVAPAGGGGSEDGPLRVPAAEEDLPWSRQRMVRWFNPRELVRTGLRAGLSHAFGQYADRRELQAALEASRREEGDEKALVHSYRDEDEVWLDYVADLGDGFEPTYAVAWQLSRPELSVEPPEGEETPEPVTTRRGRVLVMGGDQVYPMASRDAYRDRLVGPYRSAFPWCSEEPPHLYAIPGNHDWYDGLSSFLRLFCQDRWVGGWKTRQSRSYFALELPHRWWLLALDVQLSADMDRPQIDYFERVAERMAEGDRVILCSAEPAWVKGEAGGAGYETLAFVERQILRPRGVELAVALAGDYHHYARYASPDGRQRITCGGGGAYLYGTHRLPDSVELPGPEAPEPARRSDADYESFSLESVYPDAGTSKRLRWGALLAPFRNPGFGLLIGAVYLLYAWLLQSASLGLEVGSATGGAADGFMEAVHGVGVGAAGSVAAAWWSVVAHTPALALLSILLVLGCWRYARPDEGRPAWLGHAVGLFHGLGHLVLAVGLTWAIARLHLGVFGWSHGDARQFALFAVEMLVAGGLLGGVLVGLALLPGVNFNEAYSSQHRPDHKSFLRLRIDEEGTLTLYPVGVEEPGSWAFVPEADPESPRFEPEGEAPSPRLIEEPVRIPGPGAG